MSDLDFQMAFVRVNDLLDKLNTQLEKYQNDQPMSISKTQFESDANLTVRAVDSYPEVVDEDASWGGLNRGKAEVIRAVDEIGANPVEIQQAVRATKQMKRCLNEMQAKADK